VLVTGSAGTVGSGGSLVLRRQERPVDEAAAVVAAETR